MIATDQLKGVKGLVLCGGYSKRMGFDKSTIKYKGELLFLRLAEELNKTGLKTYISCREDQKHLQEVPYPSIVDSGGYKGPAMGLFSAMEKYPDDAWLAVPCDMPLLNQHLFKNLLNRRDPQKMATAYLTSHPEQEIIHPLPAIYETSIRELFKQELDAGNWSLRKILQQGDINLIKPVQPDKLVNLNRPEDLNRV